MSLGMAGIQERCLSGTCEVVGCFPNMRELETVFSAAQFYSDVSILVF